MAIAQRGTATTVSTTSGTVTLNKPTGVVEGDYMLAVHGYWTSAGPITPPEDWVLIDSGTNGVTGAAIYRKKAGASEPSSYSWTYTGSLDEQNAAMIAYSGNFDVNAIQIFSENPTSSDELTALGVTITSQPVQLVYFFGSNSSGSAIYDINTVPDGMVERAHVQGTTYGAAYIADRSWTSTGATGDFVAVAGGAFAAVNYLVALQETAGGSTHNLTANAAATSATSAPVLTVTGGPKTYYLTDTLASGTQFLSLQDGGSPPSNARLSTGWIVSTQPIAYCARMDSQTERAATAHTSTVQPNGAPDNTLGDSFRTGLLSGSFANANWSFSFQVQGETRATSTTDGRLRLRMWKSVNADGSSASEITGATQVTTAYANLANSAAQTITLTYNPGAFTLTNEYLFIQIAHELTGAGNNGSCDVHLCVGSSNSITTASFTEDVPDTWNFVANAAATTSTSDPVAAVTRNLIANSAATTTTSAPVLLIEDSNFSYIYSFITAQIPWSTVIGVGSTGHFDTTIAAQIPWPELVTKPSVTYEDSISLGASVGISDTTNLIAGAGLTLAASTGMSDGNALSGNAQATVGALLAFQNDTIATMEAALAGMGLSLAIVQATNASLGSALALLVDLAQAQTSDVSSEAALSLASLLGISPTSDAVLLASVSDLTILVDQFQAGTISADSALNLANLLGITLTANADFSAAVADLAIMLAQLQDSDVSKEAALSLANLLGILPTSDAILLAAVANLAILVDQFQTGTISADSALNLANLLGITLTANADLSAAVTDLAVTLAQFQTSDISKEAAVSIGNLLGITPEASLDIVAAMASLAIVLDQNQAGTLTVDLATAFAIELEQLFAGSISSESALSLGIVLEQIAAASIAGIEESLALAVILGQANSSQVDFSDALLLAALMQLNSQAQLEGEAGVILPLELTAQFTGELTNLTYEAVLTLANLMSMGVAGSIIAGTDLALDITVTTATDKQVVAGATLNLPITVSLTGNSQLDAAAMLSASMLLAQAAGVNAILNGGIALGVAQNIALLGGQAIFASLSQQISLGLVAQSVVFTVEAETPDCRTVTVTFEVRVSTVESETRSMRAIAETRSTTVVAEARNMVVPAADRTIATDCEPSC